MPASFASRTLPVTELRCLAAPRVEHDAHKQDVSFDSCLDEDRSHFDPCVALKATPAVIVVNISPAYERVTPRTDQFFPRAYRLSLSCQILPRIAYTSTACSVISFQPQRLRHDHPAL